MDAPPPPYSETDPSDICSNAGTGTSPNTVLTPSPSPIDTASVVGRHLNSTASSVDEVIYTPAGSVYQNHVPSDDHDHVSSVAAAAFFESRPATTRVTGPPLIHTITVQSSTEPRDLPYPESFQAKSVTEQDWATFVNYLLPDHIFNANNDIADRKLKAELMDERMHRTKIGQDEKARNISRVDAQLESLRRPQSTHNSERMDKVDVTVAEWNEGFFKPRGLQITTIDIDAEIAAGDTGESMKLGEQTLRAMPGAWIPYDHELLGESSTSRNRKGFFSGFKGFQANSQGGFRMGPIVADNEGFRIGKTGLVADGNGFRMGKMIIADQNGFRLGGSRGFVADGNGVSMGGRTFGRRESNDPEKVRGHRGQRGRSHSHGLHRRGRVRSSSTSSSSSSSSASSTESDSSVGSLPEHDELRDQQLPAAKQSLIEWLNNPELPITKDSVQHIRQDIHSARDQCPPQSDQDLTALRREVRELMKEFKDGKRAQKRNKRQARRERHALKRAQRTERKNAKREARKIRKEGKSCKKKEEGRRPPWMTSKSTVELSQPAAPPTPPRPVVETIPGFPFTRAASVPFLEGPQLSGPRSPHFGRVGAPVGMSAMHGGWSYTQGLPYAPGNIAIPPLTRGAFPEPISTGSEQLHAQAKEIEEIANIKEERAIELRTEATDRRAGENDRLKKLNEATILEEDAEKYGREADRLRVEALHLDSELARELEEENGGGQSTGIIRY